MELNLSQNDANTLYDVIIIGGGPAGLTSAIYSARNQFKTLVLDKNPYAGALGLTEKIENYPGFPDGIKGTDLLSIFKRQAENFGTVYIQEQVVGINLKGDVKEVFGAEKTYKGKSVIIATGSMGRKPSIDGEAKFIGRGVSYCATCDAPFFKGKEVAITGEIKQIIEEINVLKKFADKIYVVSKTKEITDEDYEELGETDKLEFLTNSRVIEITGEQKATGIRIKDETGNIRSISVSGIFVFLQGSVPVVDFLFGMIVLGNRGGINVDLSDMTTSEEGVFAAGDVINKGIRQVITACSEGAIAALSAEKYINSNKKIKKQWG